MWMYSHFYATLLSIFCTGEFVFMGHEIQCFIGRFETINEIVLPLGPIIPTIVELPQNFSCLFLCDAVYDTIHKDRNSDSNNDIEPFWFFNSTINKYLEDNKPRGNFIYIETVYCGGTGKQSAGFFTDGKLLSTYTSDYHTIVRTFFSYPKTFLERPINKALRQLGVIRDSKADEFDTIGLGRYRDMPNCDD